MRGRKLDSLGVSAFCESMAMMVQSGIQMDEAVALLKSGGGQGGCLEQGLVVMQAETEAGKGLSAAMETAGIFPEYAVRMVEAGESAGRLEDVLFQLARYYEDQKTMAGKLRGAVIYPVAMLGIIIVVLAVMLAMVLPAFTDVYDSLTGSLTASAYGYVKWAYALCWAALAVMVVLAAALWWGCWRSSSRYPSAGVVIGSNGVVTPLPEPTPEQQRLRGTLDVIALLGWVLFPAAGLGAAGALFYRWKLKEPIALLLEVCHHIGHHDASVHAGNWANCIDWCYWDYPLIELEGKTIGIIGFGRIGQTEGRIAKALGMKVLAYDLYPNDSGREIAEYVALDDLYARADVITLHCNLTPENTCMINKESIARMKDGVILINNARGQLINEQDVADALNSGKMGAAGLDVVYTEPIRADNPLLKAKNCIITPHISWAPKESRQRIMDCAVSNVKAYLEGAPVNVVNK